MNEKHCSCDGCQHQREQLSGSAQVNESPTGAVVLECSGQELEAGLQNLRLAPTFIAAYISPYLDIEKIGQQIADRFPGVPIQACTTAGELHATAASLYCPNYTSSETGTPAPSATAAAADTPQATHATHTTHVYWDRIIVHCFDASVIAAAEVVAVPLECEDLRRGRISRNLPERIERLKHSISRLHVSMDIDYRDTLAFILFDGLSKSESFFMEALYDSGRFPCLFFGGSAGGKSDFQQTWLHNGVQKYENHALIAFLKTAPGVRFGIFKSQNLVPTNKSFSVLSASLEQRTISQVTDQQGLMSSLIDALCDTFLCTPQQLTEQMIDYSFAISVGDELYIRSVSRIDTERNLVRLYCDVSPGEVLHLVRRGDLARSTGDDFEKFMAGKPGPPVAGILSDCILRRMLNELGLASMAGVLRGSAIAGFSTFGEILGLYLNQTLTGLFFFRVEEGQTFRDEYVDNFPLRYAEFRAFYLKRHIARLSGLSQMITGQIDDFQHNRYTSRLDSTGMDTTMLKMVEGLNSLGQVLSEADSNRLMQASQIEQKLYESEKRFRLLAESSLTGIYLIQNGYFSYVNEAFARNFGYETDEIINRKKVIDLVVPDDRSLVQENIRKRLAGQTLSIRYSFQGLRKNGSTFPVEVHGRSITHLGCPGVIGTLSDITEQKKIEAQLRDSEERYRNFYNETPSILFSLNDDGIITAVNDFAASQLGYSKEELVGGKLTSFLAQVDRQSFQDTLRTSCRTPRRVFRRQFRFLRKNGKEMWSEGFVHTITEPGGARHSHMVCQDISERKALEDSVNVSRFIFDEASIGIFLLDEDAYILDVNSHGCRSLEYSHEELCGQKVFIFDPKFDQDQYDVLTATLLRIQSVTFESTHRTKSGRDFPVQIFVSLLSHNDRYLHVAFVKDMSQWEEARKEQRKLENQLRQVQKLEAIGRLAGGVAHDLNNLLTPILGYADLLSYDPNIDDKGKARLQQISKAATGARDLAKQLLAFGRRQVLSYQPLDLNQVLEGFSGLIRRTVRENIEISISLDKNIQHILADQGQLEQVLLNLIVNASDAMPDGGDLFITTSAAELDESVAHTHADITPGLYVKLEIRDTGTGMSEETLSRVFEPFFSTKGDNGTGLGLATVYGIIKQHNGTVQVRSAPDQGSCFTVYLPVTCIIPSVDTEQPVDRMSLRGTESILLVEDNREVRGTVHDILAARGYTVFTAANGETALELLTQGKISAPSLLITDVVMPGMSGKELVERAGRYVPQMRVLYMSGYTDNIIIQQSRPNEGLHYIQKPFSSLAILQKVRQVLDHN